MQSIRLQYKHIILPITPPISHLDVCTNKAPLPNASISYQCLENNKPAHRMLGRCPPGCLPSTRQGRLLIRQALCSLIDPSWLSLRLADHLHHVAQADCSLQLCTVANTKSLTIGMDLGNIAVCLLRIV